jgi:hypothetical protein
MQRTKPIVVFEHERIRLLGRPSTETCYLHQVVLQFGGGLRRAFLTG